jgi:HEAT repeat protein
VANNHHFPNLTTARAVVEAGHRNDLTTVRRAFDDPEPAVRRASVAAAHRLNLLELPLLERFLGDPDPGVRRRAAEIAARLEPDPDLVGSLLRTLDDSPEVAEMGAFALGELERSEPEVVAALEEMARNHEDALCRESAVAALGALHSGLGTILVALGDKAAVRRRAVIALAPFDGAEVEAALRHALDDRDWQVRQAAEDLVSDDSDSS